MKKNSEHEADAIAALEWLTSGSPGDPKDPFLAEGLSRALLASPTSNPTPEQSLVQALFRRLTQSLYAEGYRSGIRMGVYEPIGIGEILDVVAHAMEVFGNRTKALRWLRTPIPSLDDETPEEMFRREGGVQRVQDVLGRIEHGVW